MFTQKPGLQFVGAKHFAHDKIIRTVIAKLGSAAGQPSNLTNDDLMSVD